MPGQPFRTYVQRDAVLRFAQAQKRYPALVEILERQPPQNYEFVQGPPGCGKTYVGARMALERMRHGRVGVTSISHKAINKFLEELRKAALEEGVSFKGRKKADDPDDRYEDEFVDCTSSNEAMLDEELELLAGTSWLFARPEFDQHLDTLFV
ncbi:MAG TPA: hypothetical protein VE693_01960, partial [Gaiellaceae bacterium]|nr:hypothetical protein [Gaiellaceae bacterium]